MQKYLVLQTNGILKEVKSEDYKSSFEMLKENVGGGIECVAWVKPFTDRGIHLWINEDGKLLDLDLSLAVKNKGEFVEVLNGNIVFARHNYEGDTIPLNDEDIAFIKKTLKCQSVLVQYDNPYTGNTLYNIVPVIEF